MPCNNTIQYYTFHTKPCNMTKHPLRLQDAIGNLKFFVFILIILEKLNLECPNVIISSQWQNHESFRANLIWFWSLHCFQKMEKMNISANARSPISNDSVGFSGIVFCDLYPTFVRGFFSLWPHCSAKQVWLPRHAFTCERLLQPPPGAPPSFLLASPSLLPSHPS